MPIAKKRLIRHELLNLFTILTISIQASEANKEEQESLAHTLNKAILLVAHEDIFSNKKPKLFLQEIDLSEMLEMVLMILGGKIKQKKVKIKTLNTLVNIVSDRSYLQLALKEIINWLIELTSDIEITWDKKTRALAFESKKGNLPKIEKIELIKTLTDSNANMELQLALEVLKMNQIKLSASPKKIALKFA